MNTIAKEVEGGGKYLNSPPLNVVDEEDQEAGGEVAPNGDEEGLQNEVDVTLKEVGQVLKDPAPVPEVDRKGILVHAAGGSSRKDVMLNEQGERFDAEVNEHYSKVGSLVDVFGGLLAKVELAVERLECEVRHTPSEVEVKRPVLRYTWESVGLVIASLLLLGVGTNTIATILIGSGIKGFENPVRAYVFSFVPAGLALGLVGVYCLLPDIRRAMYARLVWGLGLAFGSAWVVLFSRVFSGFAQSADAVLKAVLAGGATAASADSAVSSPALIACGILAEISLAAGCSIAARRACIIVEAGVKRPNVERARLAARLTQLSRSHGELKMARVNLDARFKQLPFDRNNFLNKAASFFDLSVENGSPVSHKAAQLIALFLVCAGLLSQPVSAAPRLGSRLIVGLTPHGTAAERQYAEAAILGIFLTNGWPGQIDVFDAETRTKVTSFGAVRSMMSPLAKAKAQAPAIAALRIFLQRETNTSSGEILIPQFTEHVGTHLFQTGEPPTILLIGSDLYRHREKGFHMEGGSFVPSHDHLLASMAASPYGTREKTNLLAGVRVHLICRDSDYSNKFHGDAVADFWNLFLSRQGATLVSHSTDSQTVIDRVVRGVSERYRVAQLAPIGRLCMLEVKGDQLIPVEEATPSAPPVDVAALKEQIAAGDRALQQAKSQAAKATDLAARLNLATNKLAELVGDAAQVATDRDTLAAKLEEAGRRQTRAEALARHDALIAAGDTTESLEAKRPLFEQALAIATTNHLNTTLANERLNAVRAKLTPIQLPAGVTAEVVRVRNDNYPPCLGLELAVEDAQGNPVSNLADKDFTVLLNGQRAGVKTAVVPAGVAALPPLSLVIAMDCSGSMGKALKQAKAAATAMLNSLAGRPGLRLRVMSFSSKVEAGEWTQDLNFARRSISDLKASGDTALFEAVNEAGTLLSQEAGDRRLVVLTDGCNTARSRHSPASLGDALRKATVVPYFIGLKTRELDDKALSSMASQSGGFFRMVDSAALSDVFGDAGKKLTRQAFRLVVTPKELPRTPSVPLAVFVGSGAHTISLENHIELPVPGAIEVSNQ